MGRQLRELLAYRELIRQIVARDLKVRYKRSMLGFLWALLEPLTLMLIFTVVFAFIIRIQVEHYPVFLLSGLLAWNFLSTSIAHASTSILAHPGLIKKIYFPREVFPVATVLARLVNFLLSLSLLFPLLVAFGIWPHPLALLAFPLVFAIQLAFVIGLALTVSALNTLYRDVGFILEFVLMGWFYLSPVLYPLSLVPPALHPFYMLNPMAILITAYREILLQGQLPSPGSLALAAAMAGAMLLAGLSVFRRLEPRYAEIL